MTTTEQSSRDDASDDRSSEREARDAERDQRGAEREERQADREEREAKTAEQQDIIATTTERGLHIAEDIIYAVVALVLAGGSAVVLVEAIWEFSTGVSDGVTKAIEKALSSLLIVFILVELLSAVRTVIAERTIVAEPFLIVGILAAIKEMVVLSTFRIKSEDPQDLALKIGVLGAIIVALAVATLILRRRGREPKESGDAEESETA